MTPPDIGRSGGDVPVHRRETHGSPRRRRRKGQPDRRDMPDSGRRPAARLAARDQADASSRTRIDPAGSPPEGSPSTHQPLVTAAMAAVPVPADQVIGDDVAGSTAAAPADPRPVDGSTPIEGEVLPPGSTPERRPPPKNVLELLDNWFTDASWSRTAQLAIILLVIFAGLGLLAHLLVGASALWSAIGGAVAGGGTALGAAALAHLRQRRQLEGQDDESSR